MKLATSPERDRAAAAAGNGASAMTGLAAAGSEHAAGWMPRAPVSAWRDRLALTVVWLASALYVAACLKRGWVPYDSGMFGQTAERILHGQVPFRDFIDPYSGGLTYLNALAFRLFGVNLFSIRIPLFLLFLGWVPAVYAIARRFAGPLAAGLVTLLAVAWSVPNYTEAMPSWYNLFFATWGLLALVRFTETDRSRWLWLAGLCGGLSIAVKITGLYFVAAGLLFFAFREQTRTAPAAAAPETRGRLYRAFLVVCLSLFLLLLLDAVWQRPSSATFVHFALPGACLAALLLWRERRPPAAAAGARFRALFSMALPFLAGALLPVAALLLWYARAGALPALFRTLPTADTRRTLWTALDPLSPLMTIGLVPALIILLAACSRNDSTRRVADRVAPVFLAGLLLASWKSWTVYEVVGLSVPLAVPLVALAALVWLRPASAPPGKKTEQIFLVVSVALLCALIQFPYGQPTYFYYAAPLTILAALSLTDLHRRAQRGGWAMGALPAFYLAFALGLAPPGFLITNGIGMHRRMKMQPLPFARAGGIRVTPQQEQEYARLIPLVQAHAQGPYIYATPDCPEVYFLSGLRNPTPTLYDFLDPDFLDVPARTGRILNTIRSRGVRAAVLQDNSTTSGVLPPALRAALDAEFPQSARAGDFEVRWKP